MLSRGGKRFVQRLPHGFRQPTPDVFATVAVAVQPECNAAAAVHYRALQQYQQGGGTQGDGGYLAGGMAGF